MTVTRACSCSTASHTRCDMSRMPSTSSPANHDLSNPTLAHCSLLTLAQYRVVSRNHCESFYTVPTGLLEVRHAAKLTNAGMAVQHSRADSSMLSSADEPLYRRSTQAYA